MKLPSIQTDELKETRSLLLENINTKIDADNDDPTSGNVPESDVPKMQTLEPIKTIYSHRIRKCSLDSRSGRKTLDIQTESAAGEKRRERPSTIFPKYLSNSTTKVNEKHKQEFHSLLNSPMLKKEVKKLGQSRGINLPVIKLNNQIQTASYSKQHHRVHSLDDFPELKQNHAKREGSASTSGISETQEQESPSPATSPVGHTLKHSGDYSRKEDLNRTIHSESFHVPISREENGLENADDAIDIRIFYPNGTAVQFKVENGTESSAVDLLQLMADYLGIDDVSVAEEALAIWIVSPLLEIQLKSHHVPYSIYNKWPAFLRRFTTAEEDEITLDEPLLVLRRNVLLTLDREVKFLDQYERLSEVLYLHARDEYLSGRYLVDIENTVELVGLQLAIEFGTYNGNLSEALDLIYENLDELAPLPHVKAIRSFHLFGLRIIECKGGLEFRVVEEYRTASEHYRDNNERRKAFLAILRKTPFYGAAFYSGTYENPKRNVSIDDTHLEDQTELDRSPSSTKSSKSNVSLGGLLHNLRTWLHHHSKRVGNCKKEVLIGINHDYITLIDPCKHKLLEVLRDCSPERNMSLNEKISLFCAE